MRPSFFDHTFRKEGRNEMDIASQTVTQYYAYCSHCEAHGPKMPTAQTAALRAFDAGWREINVQEDQRYVCHTFCPACRLERCKLQ